MKKILLSLVAAVTLSLCSFGQAPEGFKYQAVVRDAGNTILNNQAVGLRMTIQQGAIGGTTVYSETFAPTTNTYGLVNLEIGNGTVVSGTFANIDWSEGPYFIETAVDVTGGTNYSVMGTSQLMSVPYALYAKTSGNGQGPEGPQGNQGPAGVDGINGTNGIDGVDGIDGAAGAQGNQGLPGTNGAVGATGPQGPIGNNGATGPQGNQGLPGTNGAVGATGPQGPVGNNGATGAQGNQGLPGTNGAVGATGLAGPQGLAGNDGATGPQGPAGSTGAQGIQGFPGANGATGADGQGGVTTAGSGINVTGAGTIASPYIVSATSPCGLAIGQTYQGGIIFYLDPSGCHGLIAAPSNQSTSATWWNGSYLDTRAYGSGLFEGKYNTQIINWIQGGASSAAAICGNLTLGVYSDWYLPSIEELNKMYQNIGQGNALGLGNVGGFANFYYWSSTEYGNYDAWSQDFGNGNQTNGGKGFALFVRAIRAF
jgi:hypothetical protein